MIDLDYKNIFLIHILIGLIYLFSIVKGSMRDPADTDDLSHSLGVVVLISVFAWPYSLVCWIFSWKVWLMPVNELIIKIHLFREEMRGFYLFSLAILLFLNLMFVWYLLVFKE
ncbi:hypothetical protein SAMN05216302_101118 [Nitrosomonas aestuarii]|uniref:Uncharacterized protein n=1 Tax=Nitrosomonas aestuarii TaxID=52441 RepID=A0A1I4B6F5_9PROT|nr:hypothetical protein [Nitrosomonas aestuarii]SFK63456.1 hypothetical protein SAMN05216302_101118 [Nitrosomonas aestuarii]